MKTAHKISLAKLAYTAISGARRVIGLGDEAEVTRGAIRYRLDLSQGIDFSIYLLGTFEPHTVAACARHVRPGQTVLDIGANIGAHTFHLARSVGPNGRVFAFEPTSFAFDKLCANLKLNPQLADRVTATQAFLQGHDVAECPETVYSSWPLMGGADLHEKHRGAKMATGGAIATSLDAALEKFGVTKVDFVKMDVDGFECDVLSGATDLMKRDKPTFMLELSPYVHRERGFSFERFMSYFFALGYRFYTERGEHPLPENAEGIAALIADGAGMNAIARVDHRD